MAVSRLLIVAVLVGLLIAVVGRVGGVGVTAVGWLLPLLVAAIVLSIVRRVRGRFLLLWLPWVGFVTLSSIVTGGSDSYVRSLILVSPVIVGWAASSLAYDARDVTWTNRVVLGAAIVAVAIVFVKVFILESTAQGRLAPESVACVALGWLLLTNFRLTRSWTSLVAAMLVLLVPIIGVSRGPFVAGLSWVAVGLPFAGWRRMAVRGAFLAVCLVAAITYIRPLADKMFYESAGVGDVVQSPELIQTSGRLAAWELLVEGIVDRPVIGHGANRSESFLVQNFSEEFAHPHNDYLRLMYDYGLVGIALFVVTAVIQFRRLHTFALRWGTTVIAVPSWSAAALFVPFAMLMLVDNVLVYAAFFGNLHFLHIGMAESRHWRHVKDVTIAPRR